MNNGDKKLDAPNLKVLSDQITYESLMNKKYKDCESRCTDAQIKNLCNEAAAVHKQNFTNLKNYLDSHQ
ncbi:hypothetical protein [Clostridium oryzae]|uniref:Coat F domain protein n=1 Tax=Clostridium oryzae TaxID=1450648 RepID=A0A1V4ID98_9CLOT|nr:hypothetical protein [Clostridium oryzae]OPJ57972.1 hypothetical protein CLORY_38240 [Clostridium oryzae]